MTPIVVGVADCRLTADRGSTLVTYALGSCIAVGIHDPVTRVSGLLHFMLPDSSLDSAKAAGNPFVFADTGIPALFRRSYELGADKRRLIVRAVGGARIMDPDGVFNIGQRNCVALRRILWKAGVMIQGESTGGNTSRTAYLDVETGRMWCRGPDQSETEIGRTQYTGKGAL